MVSTHAYQVARRLRGFCNLSGALSDVREYSIYDGLGSTTGVTSASGVVTDTYAYDVFGALRSQTGSSGQPFRFTGEQQDTDVARDPYYLRARYYDPEIGRFWSKDPWPGGVTLPQTINSYSYVENAPVNWADPSGMCHFTLSCIPVPNPAPLFPPVDIQPIDIPGVNFGPTAENWKWFGREIGDLFSKKGGASDKSRLAGIHSIAAVWAEHCSRPYRDATLEMDMKRLETQLINEYRKLGPKAMAEADKILDVYGICRPDGAAILFGEKHPFFLP